jgi:TolA-binding protein
MTDSQRDFITHVQPQRYPTPWKTQLAPIGGHIQIVDANSAPVPIYCGGNTPDSPGAQECQIVEAMNSIQHLRDQLGQTNTEIANLREDCAAAHELIHTQTDIIADLQERLRGDEPTGEGWQRIVGMLRHSRKIEALSDADIFQALIELWSVHPIDSMTSCILDEVAKRGFPAQWNALAGEEQNGDSAAAGVSPSPRPAVNCGEEADTQVDASSTLYESESVEVA